MKKLEYEKLKNNSNSVRCNVNNNFLGTHCWILGQKPMLNETNADVRTYIEEFILADVVPLLYMDEVIWNGNHSSLYTNATIKEKGWDCSWCTIDTHELNRITIAWGSVTLRSELVKCHLTVYFAPNTCKYELLSPLTHSHSNCCKTIRRCWNN